VGSTRLDRRSFIRRTAAGAAVAASAPAFLRATSALAADTTTLEFWTPANDPVGKDIITKLANEYNDTQGKTDGIHVNTRIKPTPPNTDDYVQYTTAMTSSASPDVVMAYTYEPISSWAANGFIKSLDDIAKQVGVKEADYFPITWSMMNFNGHFWAFLQEFDFNRFWWNTDIHKGAPPKTFDDLDTFAKEYTKLEGGKLTQAGIIPWISSTLDWNAAWGGSFYDFQNEKWTINTPANAKFLQWYLKYVDMFGGRDKADALISSIPANYGDIFQYGKLAFAMEGEYLPAELVKQSLKLNYDIGAMPVTEGVPAEIAVVGGGNPFVLPTKAKHPEQAIKFIQYMTSAKGVNAWCIPNSNIPPVKAAATDPAFLKALPKMKPWIDALNANHVLPPFPSPITPYFMTNLGTTVDEVTYKKKTPEQALADLEKGVTDQVTKFKQSHPDWKGE
jgi:multiple sugar transport system substrate-binding protein